VGKGLLIIILGSVITLATVNMSLLRTSNAGMDNAFDYYEHMQARNMGNSMVNFLLSRVADSSAYRNSDGEKQSFSWGELDYRVIDTAWTEGDTLVLVEVEIDYNGIPKTISSFSRTTLPDGWVPPFVRAAWTANADLNNTISDMYIDGRNHDLNGNIVPNSGTMGVSSSVAFTNAENAAIGGTYDSVDYDLSYPENPDIIEDNYNWGGKFPESPDEILGYPEGTLKSIAQSGVQGSQYILNPVHSQDKIDNTNLNFPLSGVTYIELTDGIERELKMSGTDNSGILIVHGPNASSRLKGVKMEELKAGKNQVIVCHDWDLPNERTMVVAESAVSGHLAHGDIEGPCGGTHTYFQGLIVTDYSFHHHLDVLGAMLQLSPNLETVKNCNGNKDHWVNYSREAIENATGFAAKETNLVGNNTDRNNNTGFGCGRQKSTYWLE